MSTSELLRMADAPADPPGRTLEATDLRTLFHRLSNQLGIVLAHAELLEAKSPDPAQRARASQVVQAAVDATRLARGIRERVDDAQ